MPGYRVGKSSLVLLDPFPFPHPQHPSHVISPKPHPNPSPEVARLGQAGCKATECKKAGIKINKGELRLGTWVEIQNHGGWQWRHWGCVTGKQLQNLREYLEDEARPGTYRWDFFDGYDDEGVSGLVNHPDLQEKVKRVITQGFIDPEDFNGVSYFGLFGWGWGLMLI
jgi:hypothetical protein